MLLQLHAGLTEVGHAPLRTTGNPCELSRLTSFPSFIVRSVSAFCCLQVPKYGIFCRMRHPAAAAQVCRIRCIQVRRELAFKSTKNSRTVSSSPYGLHSSLPLPSSDRFKGLCRLPSSSNDAGTPGHGCDAPMGLESLFAYGGYGPWSNQHQRRVLGAPRQLERDFCARFALVCLSCPSRRLLTSPSYRISGTPHAARHRLRRRLRPRLHPGHHRRCYRHRRRPLRRRGSVFWASLQRSQLCAVLCMCVV